MKRLGQFYLNSFSGLSKEVWWLALITLINRAGTMVVPFLSLYLTKDLNFTLSDVGWIMTAFGLGSVVGSWLGGLFTDRIGAYPVMVFSLIGSGFLFIGLQYLHDFYTMCMGIFILMSIADLFRPAMFVALGAYSKPENKTRSLTLVRLAINLGFSVGPALGGLIITGLGFEGLFWVDGFTCIIAGYLLLRILNPKKRSTVEEEKVLQTRSAYTDGIYWLFIITMLIFSFIFLQLLSTLPVYYDKDWHLSELEIGLLFAGNGLIIFVLEMPLVKYLENGKLSLIHLVLIGLAIVGAGFVVLNLSTWAGVLIIGMILLTFGEMIAFPFSNAFAMKRAAKGNKGQYMAFYSIAFSVGHLFGHNAGMHLASNFGFSNTWYIMGGLALVGMLLLAILNRVEKLDVKKGLL